VHANAAGAKPSVGGPEHALSFEKIRIRRSPHYLDTAPIRPLNCLVQSFQLTMFPSQRWIRLISPRRMFPSSNPFATVSTSATRRYRRLNSHVRKFPRAGKANATVKVTFHRVLASQWNTVPRAKLLT
jgi:hypothetical protein